jgi:hypothetical protein
MTRPTGDPAKRISQRKYAKSIGGKAKAREQRAKARLLKAYPVERFSGSYLIDTPGVQSAITSETPDD